MVNSIQIGTQAGTTFFSRQDIKSDTRMKFLLVEVILFDQKLRSNLSHLKPNQPLWQTKQSKQAVDLVTKG